MDWESRLAAAQKRRRFLVDDKDKAWNWLYCAVGEHQGQFRADPTDGMPNSEILQQLGTKFAEAVQRDKIADANKAYEDIQGWFRKQKQRAAREKAAV